MPFISLGNGDAAEPGEALRPFLGWVASVGREAYRGDEVTRGGGEECCILSLCDPGRLWSTWATRRDLVHSGMGKAVGLCICPSLKGCRHPEPLALL